jgi:TPR repeat protein
MYKKINNYLKYFTSFLIILLIIPCVHSASPNKDSFEELQKAADQGDAEAQVALGAFYAGGGGVAKDSGKAAEWYKKAADQGYAKAQFLLGWYYNIGNGVAQDFTKAIEWYKKAADQGYAEAQLALGVCYAEGDGVTRDSTKAAIVN